MYSEIEKFHTLVIEKTTTEDVAEYDWLLQNAGAADSEGYQKKYRNFWTMNVAQLSQDFYTTYFSSLKSAITKTPATSDVCNTLYEASARKNGTKTIQFSFATKLLHTANPRLPIYDSRIARFYLFQEPPSSSLQGRIYNLCAFHDFLSREYARVIDNGLLKNAIAAFRQRYKPQKHTDEKIIDWLIWCFVGLLDNGGLISGKIAYD